MKLQYDEPLSNFAFNFNLHHYSKVSSKSWANCSGPEVLGLLGRGLHSSTSQLNLSHFGE